MNKMYCYLWSESTNDNECKFGERWVKAGQDPEKEVLKRIKESLGVRKDLLNQGIVQLAHIWDVSEYAKQKCSERHKQHGRVDDFIRNQIGFRKGTTGEIHELPVDDMAYRVNEIINRSNQPRPVAGLSQNQHDSAVNVLTAVEAGKRTIVAELCARFGKTIWSGTLIRETEATITIVASYVLTVFTSFKKDLSSFEQFRDLCLVDTSEEGYQRKIEDALANGRQVVAFVSMCSGTRRQDKIDFLFKQNVDKLLLIDEADFGVHKKNQSQPLIDAVDDQTVTVIMTGTNADKAASLWDVDHYLSVTYPELLMEKHQDRLAA